MKIVKVWLYGEVIASIKVNKMSSNDSVYDWLISEGHHVDILVTS